jgi:hypothetical protein
MRVLCGWMRQKHGKFWRKSGQKKEKAKQGNSPTESVGSSRMAAEYLLMFCAAAESRQNCPVANKKHAIVNWGAFAKCSRGCGNGARRTLVALPFFPLPYNALKTSWACFFR